MGFCAKRVKQGLSLIVFLFLISFAYAQDFSLLSGKFHDFEKSEEKIDFEFYNKTYSICENEKKSIPILITNKANFDSKYRLGVVGASWASLNVIEFSLAKKQSGVVFLDLIPGDDASGTYNLEVSAISSVGNAERELSLDIEVEKCYSIKLELEKEEDKVCGGEKKEYGLQVTNDGKQKIDAELSLTGPDWISVDKDSVAIDTNSMQKLELTAEPPENAKGAFNVLVTAAVKDIEKVKSEERLKLEVLPKYDCYKAEIIADSKIKNYYSSAYVSIKIRNSGIKQATYELSLEAPEWISVEPKNISVNPGQTGNFNLYINPSENLNEGTFQAKINVKFDDLVYSKNFDVVLKRNKLKDIKPFLIFYQFYIYVVLIIAITFFVFRRQIINKITTSYKKYKIRRARLKALEKARAARQKSLKRKKK